jgi:hypothetical protein
MYKLATDGLNIIRIDDPNDIEFLSNELMDKIKLQATQ